MTIQTDTTYVATAKRKATATDAKYPGWIRFLILTTAVVVTWGALALAGGYAVSVILAAWPA